METRRLRLDAAAVALPLTLAEIKVHLGEDEGSTAQDATLLAYLRTSVAAAESFTGRALITQFWTLVLDAWPASSARPLAEGWSEGPSWHGAAPDLYLPKPPLQAVAAVRTYDDQDAATLWLASNYYVDTVGEPGRIVPRAGQTWPAPTRSANGIEIDFRCGYGDRPADVPQPLRDGLLKLIEYLHDCGGTETGADVARASGAAALWRPYRVLGL